MKEKKEKLANALEIERNKLTQIMQGKHFGLVLSESCTGGALAHHITNADMAGYMLLSIIPYDEGAKTEVLGVPRIIIDKFGLYSCQTAVAMAVAALRMFPKANIAGASTGIIGRKDNTAPDKKRGEVYLAVAIKEGITHYRIVVRQYFLEKEKGEKRSKIKKRAGVELFKLIRKVLLESNFGRVVSLEDLIMSFYESMKSC